MLKQQVELQTSKYSKKDIRTNENLNTEKTQKHPMFRNTSASTQRVNTVNFDTPVRNRLEFYKTMQDTNDYDDDNIQIDDILDQDGINEIIIKKLKILEQNAKFFEAQAHPLFVENNKLKDEIIRQSEQIRAQTRQFSTLVRDQSEKGETRDLLKKIGDLDQIFKVLEYDVNFYKESLTGLNDDRENLKQKIKVAEYDLFESKLNFEKNTELQKLEFNNQIQKLSEKEKDLERIITTLQQDLSFERSEKSAIVDKKNQEIKNIKVIIDQQRQKMAQIDEEHLKERQNLENSIIACKEQFLKDKSELIEKYENYMKETKETLGFKIQSISEESENKIRLLNENVRQKDDQMRYMSDDYNRIKAVTDKEILELANKIENERLQSREVRENLNRTSMELSSLGKYKEELELERNNMESELTSFRNKFRILEEEAEDQISNKNRRLRDQTEEIERLEEEWKQKFERQQLENEQRFQDTVSDITNSFEYKLKKLRNELERQKMIVEKEKGETIKQLTVQIHEIQEENSKIKRVFDIEMGDLQQRYKEMEKNMKKRVSDLETQLNFASVEHKNQLKKLLQETDDQKNQDLSNLEKRKNLEIFNLKKDFETNMKQLEASLLGKIKDAQQLLKETQDDYEKRLKKQEELFELQKQKYMKEKDIQVQQIQMQLDDSMEKAKGLMNSESKGMLEEMKNQQFKQKEIFQKEIEQIKENVGKQFQYKLNNLEQQVFEQGESIEKYKAELNENQITIGQLKNTILELENRYKQQKQEFKNQVQGYIANIDELKKDLKDSQKEKEKIQIEHQTFQHDLEERLNKKLNQALQDHLDFTESMQKQQDDLLQSQIILNQQLNENFMNLQTSYDERPSRPDDIQMIKELKMNLDMTKKQALEQKQLIKSTENAVQYLQLEVENYKSIYDMFGPNSDNKKIPQEILDKLQKFESQQQNKLPQLTQQGQLTLSSLKKLDNQSKSQTNLSLQKSKRNQNTNSQQNSKSIHSNYKKSLKTEVFENFSLNASQRSMRKGGSQRSLQRQNDSLISLNQNSQNSGKKSQIIKIIQQRPRSSTQQKQYENEDQLQQNKILLSTQDQIDKLINSTIYKQSKTFSNRQNN